MARPTDISPLFLPFFSGRREGAESQKQGVIKSTQCIEENGVMFVAKSSASSDNSDVTQHSIRAPGGWGIDTGSTKCFAILSGCEIGRKENGTGGERTTTRFDSY